LKNFCNVLLHGAVKSDFRASSNEEK